MILKLDTSLQHSCDSLKRARCTLSVKPNTWEGVERTSKFSDVFGRPVYNYKARRPLYEAV